MPDAPERPAFTVAAAAARPSLPVEAWALANFGVAAVFSGALRSGECFDWCSFLPLFPLLLLGATLVAALSWFALPISGGHRATLRAAGALCTIAGVVAFLPYLLSGSLLIGDARGLPLLAAVGLAAPAVMMPALSPGASIVVPGAPPGGPSQWLRVGAVPVTALFAGFWSPLFVSRAEMVGAAAVLVAGLILVVAASKAPSLADPKPPLASGRAAAIWRMTPMSRFEAAADVAVAFSVASCATAAAAAWGVLLGIPSLVAAASLGGLSGAVAYGILAPTVDAAWGRGRLLALSIFAAAVAPLLLLARPGGMGELAVFASCALIGVALSSAPQRGALAFDLASSQGRARLAADLQGLKVGAAALAPPAFFLSERVAPGMGPLAGALVAVVALTLFAPTLGSLGVPRR